MTRTTLTKSLHTVSAVAALAAHLLRSHGYGAPVTAPDAVRDALRVLGQPTDWADTDPTFAACVAKVEKMRPTAPRAVTRVHAEIERAFA